jgi:hypothetical protein
MDSRDRFDFDNLTLDDKMIIIHAIKQYQKKLPTDDVFYNRVNVISFGSKVAEDIKLMLVHGGDIKQVKKYIKNLNK